MKISWNVAYCLNLLQLELVFIPDITNSSLQHSQPLIWGLSKTYLSFKDPSWRQSWVISRCWCQLAQVNFLNHNSLLCTCIIQYSLFLKPLSIDSFHTSLINLSNFIVFYFIPLEITSHSKLRSSLLLHINIGWSEILRRNSLRYKFFKMIYVNNWIACWR